MEIPQSCTEPCNEIHPYLFWDWGAVRIPFDGVFTRSLQWRPNECNDVSNHRRLDGLLSHLFRRRSKKSSKLRVTFSVLLAFLCGEPPVTDGFPSQRASNTENISIWWRHHAPCVSVLGSAQDRPHSLTPVFTHLDCVFETRFLTMLHFGKSCVLHLILIYSLTVRSLI